MALSKAARASARRVLRRNETLADAQAWALRGANSRERANASDGQAPAAMAELELGDARPGEPERRGFQGGLAPGAAAPARSNHAGE